jgi:hypothetical protein
MAMLNRILRIFVIDFLIFDGGAILFFVIMLENRIAFPVTGTNYPLDHVMEWTVILWMVARWGHYLKDPRAVWASLKALVGRLWSLLRA